MERDAAWAALHDPETDAATLMEIAQRYPEFAEAIAAHPNCYDGLREWLAQQAAAAGDATAAPGTDAVAGAADAAQPGGVDAAASSTAGPMPDAAPAAPRPLPPLSMPEGPSWLDVLRRRPVLIGISAAAAVLVIGGFGLAFALSGGGQPADAGAGGTAAAPSAASAPPVTVCPTMAPETIGGSDSSATATPQTVDSAIAATTTRVDAITALASISPQGQDLANKLQALPIAPQNGLDALRALMFSSPKSVAALRSLDGQLTSQCGGHLVGDLSALIADVPTMTGDRVTHADDTFGMCSGSIDRPSLGWIGTAQIFLCEQMLVSLDYAKHRLAGYAVTTDGGATNESSLLVALTGKHIVWTRTTEKPQSGLAQPLFTGTLYSTGPSLDPPTQTAVFTDQAEQLTPEFFVEAAADDFVVVGGRPAGSVYLSNSPTAPTVLYDLSGPKPVKAQVAPMSNVGVPDVSSGDLALHLVPLWGTIGGLPAYFDIKAGQAVAGLSPDERWTDGGCGRVAIAADPAHPYDNDPLGVGSGAETWHFFLLAGSASGALGGKADFTGDAPSTLKGITPDGMLRSNDDQGVSLIGYDGAQKWSIPGSVATLTSRALGHLLMTNASGQPVVVDEESGKEVTDPSDEVAQLMKTGAAAGASGSTFVVVQDGDQVVLTSPSTNDGEVALVLDRAKACPSMTVPGATTPLAQLLAH